MTVERDVWRSLQNEEACLALERLREDGLIEVDREEIVDSRLRRYYRLTPDGYAALASETARLTDLATLARRVLAARPRPALGTA